MAFKFFVWPTHNREDKPTWEQMRVFKGVAEKFESIIIGSNGSNKFAIKASVRESSGNAGNAQQSGPGHAHSKRLSSHGRNLWRLRMSWLNPFMGF